MVTRKTAGKKTNDSNSAAEAVKAMVNAAKDELKPPPHCRMRNGDEPFWTGVILSKARDEWTESDLVVAAQLARTQRDLEDEQEALDREDTVVRNDRGTLVMNPRVSVLEGLARREMALMRTLRMGGKEAGDPRNLQKKRALERESRNVRKSLTGRDTEGLLA